MTQSRQLVLASMAAGSLLLVMIAISVFTGVSQQSFEWFMPPHLYAEQLLAGAGPLRAIIGLDNLFIACYSMTVFLLVQVLWQHHARYLLFLVLAASLTGGVLDYIENHHILSMLTIAEYGEPLNAEDIKQQMVASMLKWHLAYFAFFALAFSLRPANRFEHLFRCSLVFIQLPVGVFYYIGADTAWGEILFAWRYLNLLLGFFIFAWIFSRRTRQRTDSEASVKDREGLASSDTLSASESTQGAL